MIRTYKPGEKMLRTYELACNIDIMSHPRVTASKGRFSTSDPRIQRILSGYPGVTLLSVEPEPVQRPLTPAEGLSLYGPGPDSVRVSNTASVQMKPRKGD
jgi:hypothetical protein